jgi:hypothetical protein
MREGYYAVRYLGPHGEGCAVFALDTGEIIGVDISGAS